MTILLILLGLVSGILICLAILWFGAQRIMLHEDESKLSFEETLTGLEKEVTEKDWKLLHVHDLQAKMMANGYDVLEAQVFDVCKPCYASQILMRDKERIFSSMMPCRVAVYRKSDGKTYISRMNAALISRPMKGVIPKVMKQAADDVEVIIAPLLRT